MHLNLYIFLITEYILFIMRKYKTSDAWDSRSTINVSLFDYYLVVWVVMITILDILYIWSLTLRESNLNSNLKMTCKYTTNANIYIHFRWFHLAWLKYDNVVKSTASNNFILYAEITYVLWKTTFFIQFF